VSLRVLHVLDHSLPLHSGYTFRTLSILQEQGRIGWETSHLTGPKQDSAGRLEESIDGTATHLVRDGHVDESAMRSELVTRAAIRAAAARPASATSPRRASSFWRTPAASPPAP